jgi:hypothetical protein
MTSKIDVNQLLSEHFNFSNPRTLADGTTVVNLRLCKTTRTKAKLTQQEKKGWSKAALPVMKPMI